MTSGQTRRFTRLCIGSIVGGVVGGVALAGLAAPMASAAPDCSQAGIDSAVSTATQQARAYLNSNPAANKILMTAALQPQTEAAATISAYANSNPQEYADFKAILTPLSSLQNQCGVQVIPAEYQWAFNQFIG
ncbi:hemophore-related protein [Mycolicibacterium sp.]|jgi:hemophore-related protein|uniref:hemophore-related protein n=1 Tax=Mycolicibacterium sp. TaxID=2320850 RepID=UPI0028AEB3F9|nr:hemophore-related protein [Mycolicibacterium sp.]